MLLVAGKCDEVLEMRRPFQRVMEVDLIRAVEEITGRRVIAFLSDNQAEPDLAAEIFVLEPVSGSELALDAVEPR
jgi:hypothetical protein